MALLSPTILRFSLIGGLTVGIDFVVYMALTQLGLPVHIAKAISFVSGAIFAYIVNRSFTFQATDQEHRIWRFVLIYVSGLALNVGLNALCLFLFKPIEYSVILAFLVSTGCSAVYNYLGMKLFVFAKS